MPMGNTLKLEDLLKPDCVPDESAGGENWRILHGDTLKLVKGFQPGIFDAVITDPPYASGGTKQNERNRTTNQKYSSMKAENALPDFDGDNKDQRSWTHWMAEWLYDVRKACKRGAPICLFIDWRQYPSITDALQWAGWIWRGTAVWDKGNSRPQKGRFRQQAEYIVWGSNGPMPINRPVSCLPGVFRYGNPQNRIHVTEKPLQLMKDVIQICEPGGLILDPFAGAGTTILAAAESGFQAVGIEVIISWEATVSALHWKLGKKRKTKNHSSRMSGRHLKKRRKESRCPQDIHRAECFVGVSFWKNAGQRKPVRPGKEMVVLEQALAYVCCSAEEGKTKVQRYCRKIYELGYVPICPQYSFSPFLDDGDAEDMQAMRRMSHQILRRCRMVVVCGKETTGTMNTEISMADRLHIICTTLDGLSKIKENE